MRESVLFYRSFAEAIECLPESEQLKAYKALINYGLYGTEPELEGSTATVFILSRAQIDANNRRYENGKKGGRPNANQTETKAKPNRNQTETKPKAKDKVKVKDKVKDKDNNTNSALTRAQIESIFERVWKAYPEKRGKARVSEADKKRIAQIGEEKMLRAIERYKEEVLLNKTWLHYQNGSTFFHSGYLDYLDDNFEPTATKDKRPAAKFNNEVSRGKITPDLERELLGVRA